MAQISADLTSSNLSGLDNLMSSVASRASGGCYVRFFWDQIRLKTGDVETRLFLVRQPVGDTHTVSVRRVTPEFAAREFPEEWHRFNTYDDGAPTGTPLSELPGATHSMIGIVLSNGVRSIEDLADLPADIAAQGGMDLNRARQLALAWVKRRDDSAGDIDLAGKIAQMEARMNAIAKENEALRQANLKLEARAEARAEYGTAAAPAAGQQMIGNAIAVADPEGLGSPSGDEDMFGPLMSEGDDIDPLAD